MSEVKKKILGFDSIRGFAALIVFLFHFWSLHSLGSMQFSGLDFTPLFSAGYVGLDIFFVLSGFLIFYSLYRHGVNKQYFFRRFLRIAPLYYFSIFIVILLLQRDIFITEGGPFSLFSHLFFFHSFALDTYYSINPVLWSLSVEMIFYFFLPLVFLVTGKKTWKILAGILAMIGVTYIYRYYLAANLYPTWDLTEKIVYTENFIGRLDHFALGMLAALGVFKFHNYFEKRTWISLVLMVISVCGFTFGISQFHTLGSGFRDIMHWQLFLHTVIAASAALFMFSLTNAPQIIQKIMENPVTKFLGVISYSFYVWHFIIIEQVQIRTTLSVPEQFYLSFVITFGFSTLTYFLIEKTFLRLKRY